MNNKYTFIQFCAGVAIATVFMILGLIWVQGALDRAHESKRLQKTDKQIQDEVNLFEQNARQNTLDMEKIKAIVDERINRQLDRVGKEIKGICWFPLLGGIRDRSIYFNDSECVSQN